MATQTLDKQIEKETKLLKFGDDISEVLVGEVIQISYPKSLVSRVFTELVTGFVPGGIRTLSEYKGIIHVYERPISDGKLCRPAPYSLLAKKTYRDDDEDIAKKVIYDSLHQLLKQKKVIQ